MLSTDRLIEVIVKLPFVLHLLLRPAARYARAECLAEASVFEEALKETSTQSLG